MRKCRLTGAAFAIAAVASILTLSACGGGDSNRQAASSTAAQAAPAKENGQPTTTLSDEPGGAPGKKKEAAKKSKQARNGVSVTKGAAKPAPKAHAAAPQKPKPSAKSPNIAPASSGKGIFAIAKGICSNPAMLAGVPEGIRDDNEAVAKYAEIFAPPGQKQQAHDGCLAGLKSSGR